VGGEGSERMGLEGEGFAGTKVCAGWIPPEVVSALEMDVARYPRGLVRLDSLHLEYFAGRRPWRTVMRALQYSIRRYEFDDWLLRPSGAPGVPHPARQI